MNRVAMLFSVCAGIVAAAVALRVRSHLGEHLPFAPDPTSTALKLSLPAPRDRVLQPWMAPGEENLGPRRIISLAPSITETLCALGLRERIVGRTPFCSYPPEIKEVPAVGGVLDTNLEWIRALQPDLVAITTTHAGLAGKLTALGLGHAAIPHESFDDVFEAIAAAGRACDRPETARQLVATIRDDLNALENSAAAARVRPRRVLMVTGGLRVPPGALWVAGPGSFLDALLRRAGHLNAAAEILREPHGEVPLERLLVLDPEVILTFPDTLPTPDEMDQALRSWMRVGRLQAIGYRRVRAVGGAEWLSAGPRIALELHRIMTVLAEFSGPVTP